jgi:hypothetical protein
MRGIIGSGTAFKRAKLASQYIARSPICPSILSPLLTCLRYSPFSVHPFLIVDYSYIVKLGAVLLDECRMDWVGSNVVVSVLPRRKFNHEAMGEAALSRSVSCPGTAVG